MTEAQLISLILKYAAQFPKVTIALTVMVSLQIFIKPLVDFLRWWVSQTPSKRDDKKLEKFLSNRYVKVILYVIEWLGSIKIKAEARPNGGDNGSI